MKVLVAGRGFIGKKVVERLRNTHQVKTLDRGADATFQQDITEEFEIDESFDVLIHTIGLAPGMYGPGEYEEVHVEGTQNLIEAVDAEKVVFLSALGAGKVDHSFFETKREAEKIIVNNSERHTVLRPSTVYGEGNKLLDLIGKAAPTMIFPDIKTLTQPIHVDDVVSVIDKTLEGFDNQVLELGGPEELTVGEMAKKIYNERGFPCVLLPAPMVLQKAGLTVFSPLPSPFNRENIKILEHQNTTNVNDAEKILGQMKPVFSKRK